MGARIKMVDDGFLQKYYLSNGDKILNKWFHYFDIYERHFERFREMSPKVLEIGVSGGGSLQMWKAYFGQGAQIVGIDIDPECKKHEGDGIDIFIGSQDSPALIDEIVAKYTDFDIVIDDGSHIMRHMMKSFELLYHKVKPDGLYLVEDLHTAYEDEYEGGLKRAGTFIEFIKDKIDELNATYTGGEVPVSAFTRSTDCIAIYDGIVVFEKKPQGRRQAAVTSSMALAPPPRAKSLWKRFRSRRSAK
jgi:23S rRNA U2552 (ribose-2'-O)-methylase RlmE/FtsJ